MTQGSPSGATALSAPRFRPADAGRTPRSWTFGDFRLDEGERRLLRRGTTVPLTPKAFDLLVALLEKGGRLVRKHELLERLWPSLFVGEGTLARHVSSLRKALSDDSSRTPLIQTVHKSGYRFLGQAKEASEREAPDVVACSLYLRGRHFWGRRTEGDLKKALSYFDESILRDPGRAAAHAARADCLTLLAGYGGPPAALAEARQAAAQSLALDPECADAHVVLALIAQRDRDWEQAEARYESALRLQPNHTTARHRRGELLALLGRFDEGLALLEHACQMEPASLIHGSDLAKALFFARRYEDASREARGVLEMDPTYPRARLYLGLSAFMSGDVDGALSTLLAFGKSDSSAYAQGIVAYASARAGRPQVAREVLWALHHLRRSEYVTPYSFALTHLGLGEHETALDCLERVVDEGHNVLGLSVTPLLEPLHGERRFQALLAAARLSICCGSRCESRPGTSTRCGPASTR